MTETIEIGTNYIVRTPGNLGGDPRIAGRRIGVKDIVVLYIHLGATTEEIAQGYTLTYAQIYAALSYYYDHQEEIDTLIKEDADAFERLGRRITVNATREELLQRLKQRDPRRYQRLMAMHEEHSSEL